MAEYYEINVTISWIVTAVVLVAILAISVPPIPGAGMTCYGIMFAQLGIPDEGILIAATLAAGLDFFITAYNMMMLQLEVLGQGIVIQKEGYKK